MWRSIVMCLAVLVAGCGDESATCAEEGACDGAAGTTGGPGGAGGSGGAGNTGGSGGTENTGGTGGTFPVDACADFDEQRARSADPFALVATVGTAEALPEGFDVEMELVALSPDFTVLDFEGAQQRVTVRWPRTQTVYAPGNTVRVSRTRDWLVLRTPDGGVISVLHASSGNRIPDALEKLPEDDLVFRFAPQCDLGTGQGCSETAVRLESDLAGTPFTVNDGWVGGPQNGYWNIEHWTALRRDCAGAGFATVVVADGYLFQRGR